MENHLSLFSTATRKKYRFPFNGLINTEDLWDLSVVDLNKVYESLARKKAAQPVDSLITDVKIDPDLENQLEIVRFIFNVKNSEAEERAAEAVRAQKKKELLQILADKENENLKSKSADEIRAMLEDF